MNRKDSADLDRHITGNYGEDSVDAQTQGWIDATKAAAEQVAKLGLKVDVRTGQIGPSHDPYGTEEVTVTKPDGASASYYTDGLGTCKVNLYAADGKAVDELRWFDTDRKAATYGCSALAAFEKHVGISPGSAKSAYEFTYEPDPMGHPSQYE